MSGVDDLFGSDDEGAAPQAAAPPKDDKKSKLEALAAAQKRKREEEAQAKKERKPNKKQRADAEAEGGGGGGGSAKKRLSKKSSGKGEKKKSGKKSVGGSKKVAEAEPEAGGIDFGDDEDSADDEDWAAEEEDVLAGEDLSGGSGDEGERGGGGSRRQAELAEREARRAAAAAVPVPDEDPHADLEVNDEDRAFIDDEGAAPGDVIDWGDDEEQMQQHAEAEEAAEGEDELDAVFSKKKKRGRDEPPLSGREAKAAVENILTLMEMAVEDDMRAYDEGRPAVEKLKLLAQVQDVLSTKCLHSELLDSGVLGVLKAWLEPMSDGALPNARVRETVLRLLHQLPVDCSMEDRKEQLKKSGLGRMIMFLFKLPDETVTNRRLAKELVERWSRPILAPSRARELTEEERSRILLARQQRQAKAAEAAAAAAEAVGDEADEERGGRQRQPKMGEAGFRFHAAIPQAAALDYVKAPTGRYAMPEAKKPGGKGKGGDEHRLTKKLASLAKGAKATGRAAVASVEGRNVTVQH